MIHRYIYFLTAILLLPLGICAKTFPDSLSRLVVYQPNKALELLKTNVQQLQKYSVYHYYYAQACTNLGMYVESDSIVGLELKSSKLKSDSGLYIRLLLLNAENKRVLNHYDEAFVSLEKVYEFHKLNNDSLGLLDLLITFAEYYRSTHNFPLALSYIQKAEQLGYSLKNGFPILTKTRLMNRKAAIYSESTGSEDSVIVLSKEVIRLATVNGDPVQLATSSNELGFYYSTHDKYVSRAEPYLKNAIRIWDSLDYGIYENNAKHNLAWLYFKLKQPPKTIRIAIPQLAVAKANGWKKEEGVWHEVLSTAYASIGNFEQAYIHQKIAAEISIVTTFNQFNQRLAYYSNRLGLKEKEELLHLKQEEVVLTNERLAVKLTENRFLVVIVILLVLVLGIAVTAVVVNIRQKQVVSAQRNEIHSINETLTKLLSEKETLLKEINHRVKNNLSLLSSIIYLKERKVEDEDTIASLREIRSRIYTIALIHELLYQDQSIDQIDFNQYLKQLCFQITEMYAGAFDKEVQLEIDCHGLFLELPKAVLLAMIINELMTNSYKHAFAKVTDPAIKISYDAQTGVFEYGDNGPGYQPNEQTGVHGYSLIKLFTQQLNVEVANSFSNHFFITQLFFSPKPIHENIGS